ncbi:MAG: LysR family transcriptional regulator, partial [Hyphomicrobiales bacterium]|nr:LysR family transcriptional regulator [Hyphomicrobiales bacterium]
AAEELALSPSAVSHAIRKLEDALGVHLFERGARRVALTVEGERLLLAVGDAFERMRGGLEAVATRGPQLLRLHCAPSFAAQWLTPRLSRFLAAEPAIEVRLAAGIDYARFSNDDFDADVVYGPPRADGIVAIPLGEETVTPLCSPARAAAIRTPADLTRQPLIRSDAKQVGWDAWCARNGASTPSHYAMRFDRSFLAIAAAADGLGVALESTRLAEREISAGRLVAPLAGEGRDIVYVGHRFVYPRSRPRRVVRAFAAWLSRELGLPTPAAEDAGGIA